MVLVENDTIFSEKKEVAEIFRSYFHGLNIKCCGISLKHSDPTLNAIYRFFFENVSPGDIKKSTREPDISKAFKLLDIPTNIIYQNTDIFSQFFFVNINHCINNSTFQDT